MAKKVPAKKVTVKKATPKKAAAQKPAAKKSAVVKQAPAKQTPAKRVPKKPAAKKSAAKPAVKKATPAKKASPAEKPQSQPKGRAKTKPSPHPAAAEAADSYLATLNDWRKDAVASLRKMIQQAVPHADEKVADSQSVYEHHGPFAWIKAHAQGVNLGFLRGVELPDPRKLLEGTQGTVRHINLSSLKDAGKKELEELVKLASKLNEVRQSRSAEKPSAKKPPQKKAKHK